MMKFVRNNERFGVMKLWKRLLKMGNGAIVQHSSESCLSWPFPKKDFVVFYLER